MEDAAIWSHLPIQSNFYDDCIANEASLRLDFNIALQLLAKCGRVFSLISITYHLLTASPPAYPAGVAIHPISSLTID